MNKPNIRYRFSVVAVATLLLATTAKAQQPIRYDILTSQPRQHIEHFGASDAWSMQFIGLWPEKQQLFPCSITSPYSIVRHFRKNVKRVLTFL